MKNQEIISGIKHGSESAWNKLLSSLSDPFCRQIKPILKDVRDITFDDVFEEACIDLMENIKAGKLDEGENNLEGYFFRICKRKALRYASKKKNISVDDDNVVIKDVGSELLPGTPDEESEDDALVNAFLERVLETMPQNQQELLRHFFWDKMSMAEIAAVHGLKNENVAKSLKKRYMENFKKKAKKMLDDDLMAEEAIGRVFERAALRDQIDECRHLESGVLQASACKGGKKVFTEKDIIEGVRNNSPSAWKALYAYFYERMSKDLSQILE